MGLKRLLDFPLGLQSPLNSLGPRSQALAPRPRQWQRGGSSKAGAREYGKVGACRVDGMGQNESRILGETGRSGGLGDRRPKVTLFEVPRPPWE